MLGVTGAGRFAGLRNMFLARSVGWTPLRETAVVTEFLAEEGVEEIPPPAMLPYMPERVVAGVPGFTTAAQEREALTARALPHGPVIRYTLPDCLVHRGGIEYPGGFWGKTGSRIDRLPLGRIEEIAEGDYCMSPQSHEYFGHWLRDACSIALLADRGSTLFLDDRADWPDAARYASAFGLPTRKARPASVGTLRVYVDPWFSRHRQARYDTLRRRLQQRYGPHSGPDRPVYLRRGRTGRRRGIVNEAELCRALRAQGFDILDVSCGMAERFGKLAKAPLVVSLDGSHLNHAHFAMRPGSAVLALIPAPRPSAIHRVVSHAMGMRFGCVVLEAAGSQSIVRPSEVLQTIELLA